MDDDAREITAGWILIKENLIEEVGEGEPPAADVVIDAAGTVVLPGFVNTHHHMYQTLTRNFPRAQDVFLFDWLKTLYEVWRGLTEEAVFVSAQVAVAELLLSGCTTSTDHLYIFPSDASGELIDREIDAALGLGMRFHPTRGSMSLGVSNGGLPPDDRRGVLRQHDVSAAVPPRQSLRNQNPSEHGRRAFLRLRNALLSPPTGQVN